MVANFQCSDRNFLHFRGFLDLHARVTLDLQFDIECIERELDALDRWDKESGLPNRLGSLQCKDRDRRASTIDKMPAEFVQAGFTRTRPEAMRELRSKLMQYGKLNVRSSVLRCAYKILDEVLLNSKAVNGLNRPSNRDHRSVLSWFAAKTPLVEEEAEYIQRKEDLVSIHAGRKCGGFDGLVERYLTFLDKALTRCNCHVIKASDPPGGMNPAQCMLMLFAEDLLIA